MTDALWATLGRATVVFATRSPSGGPRASHHGGLGYADDPLARGDLLGGPIVDREVRCPRADLAVELQRIGDLPLKFVTWISVNVPGDERTRWTWKSRSSVVKLAFFAWTAPTLIGISSSSGRTSTSCTSVVGAIRDIELHERHGDDAAANGEIAFTLCAS